MKVIREASGSVSENACWLFPPKAIEPCHISLAGLNIILKAVNLSLKWHTRKIHLKMDSVCVSLDIQCAYK